MSCLLRFFNIANREHRVSGLTSIQLYICLEAEGVAVIAAASGQVDALGSTTWYSCIGSTWGKRGYICFQCFT